MKKRNGIAAALVSMNVVFVANPSYAEDKSFARKLGSFLQDVGSELASGVSRQAQKSGASPAVGYNFKGSAPVGVPNIGGIVTSVAGATGAQGIPGSSGSYRGGSAAPGIKGDPGPRGNLVY